MLSALEYAPPGFNEQRYVGHQFIELSHEGRPYAYAAARAVGSDCALHLQMVRFDHKVLRHLLVRDWPTFKRAAREEGVSRFYVSNAEPDDKWRRFIALLGFPAPETVAVSSMEV